MVRPTSSDNGHRAPLQGVDWFGDNIRAERCRSPRSSHPSSHTGKFTIAPPLFGEGRHSDGDLCSPTSPNIQAFGRLSTTLDAPGPLLSFGAQPSSQHIPQDQPDLLSALSRSTAHPTWSVPSNQPI